jgi:hypothetical protein
MHTIDCSIDPNSLTPISEAVLQRVAEIREDKPSQKIAIVCGETHNVATHVHAHAGVLMNLVTEYGASNVSYASEIPHNTLEFMGHNLYGLDIPTKDIGQIDPNGKLLLGAFVGNRTYVKSGFDAPDEVTDDQIFKFCYDKGIKFIPADVDRSQAHVTQAFLESQKIQAVRNQHMAVMCKQENTVVLRVGLAHVLGFKKPEHPFVASCKAAFERFGFKTISILPDTALLPDDGPIAEMLPTDANLEDVFIAKGLNPAAINIDFGRDQEPERLKAIFSATKNMAYQDINKQQRIDAGMDTGDALFRACKLKGLPIGGYSIYGRNMRQLWKGTRLEHLYV